ncbi:DUF2207 domain-containing protein [Leucobacter edaphi]|uniref:DUF2207 domain-containing protein n=1 Tax=Leucobacter edaphi TaxID=2796472 RepID=UPI0034E27EA0
MSRGRSGDGSSAADHDPFDLAGSDPELLRSGRIPDPQPEHTPFFGWIASVLTALEERLRARGSRGLRNGIRAIWVVVGLIGAVLLVGPIINKPLDFEDVIDSAKLSDVDWIARDAEVDYALSRDGDGRFVAEVRERFTADFRSGSAPKIERTIVTEYAGHDVRFQLGEVTVDGKPVDPKVSGHPTNTDIVILPGEGGEFSGTHTITYAYTLRDLVTAEIDEASGAPVDRWDWPLFAPTWPQATKGIDVSLTLAPELEASLVRQPRASVGWLLLSATSWLDAEGETPDGGTRYSFSNDQTLPPNADLWVSANFTPGTFAQPPTTALFWLQTYGPLLPLVLLAAIAVAALAARRVVWADSAGKPWYTARSEPPEGISPELATRLLERSSHAALVAALGDPPRARAEDRRRNWLARVARTASRTGRPGSLPETAAAIARWPLSDPVVDRKLRWVPSGYVRDAFLLAPIAMVLVQWGLLRQLSAQVVLAIVWWPFAFVALSTVLGAIAFFAALRPRPLTPKGALAVQELRGIDAFARATRLLERGPITDPLIPYAILLERPRRAGKRLTALAAVESGDREIAKGWRSERFISLPALLSAVTAAAALVLTIVTAATISAPYAQGVDFATEHSDIPGSRSTESVGFSISAQLGRDAKGAARIDVTEHHTVRFEEDAPRPPQFTREWPAERIGQSLGLRIDGILIDGKKVPIRELSGPSTRAVTTALAEVVEGQHEVEVRYSLGHAAVAARVPDPGEAPGIDTGGAGGGSGRGERWVEQVRWTAQLPFWTDEVRPADGSLTDRVRVDPARIELVIAPSLMDRALSGGWLDTDYDRPKNRFERGNSVRPWRFDYSFGSEHSEGLAEGTLGSFERRADGAGVAVLDLGDAKEPDFTKYSADLSGDLGAMIDFPAGTFTGVDRAAAERYAIERSVPYAVTVGGAGLVLIFAVILGVLTFRSARPAGFSRRFIAFLTLPVFALAQSVLNGWAILSMPSGEAAGAVAIAVGVAMWIAVGTAALIVWRRSREPVAESVSKQPRIGEE